jgi:polyisoprenoid-binding protein YceI
MTFSAFIGVYPRILQLVCVATLAITPAWAQKPQKVDTARSSIRFVSKQMGVPVEGRFRRFDATIAFDPARPEATQAEFEVDLASIDLGHEEGETEVRRPLWFDIAKYPQAKFVVSSVKAAGPGKFEASGALTMKGITHPVSAPVTVTEASGVRVVDGQFALRRLQFRVGEGHWSDTETVADEVLVRFRFTFPSTH